MAPPTKEQMKDVLSSAGIDVPVSATIGQIRGLYQELVKKNRVGARNTDDDSENSEPDVNETAGTSEQNVEPTDGNEQTMAAGNSKDDELMEVNKQLEILKKKKELMALQNEINAMAGPSVQPMTNKITDVSVIESMVNKFSADDNYDVHKWIMDLEDACLMLQFDERLRLVACRRMLDGTARVFLRTISVSTYEELKKALIDEFGRQYTQQEVYFQLRNRKMKANETVHRYILEMQEIALRATIAESELVDIIIDGIRDVDDMMGALWAATTMDGLKRVAERCERKRVRQTVANVRTIPNARQVITPTGSTAYANVGPQRVIPKPSNQPPMPSVSDQSVRCYNCSQFGHYKGQCPKPLRPDGSCFKCGEMTHVYRNCPQRKMTQTAATVTFGDIGNLEETLNAVQMVSVAFNLKGSRYSELIKCVSLLDSGSPKSFVQLSMVPYVKNDCLLDTRCRGIGGIKLMACGEVNCRIQCQNRWIDFKIFVVPDDLLSIPMLLGRDFLAKAQIKLVFMKRRYSKEKLMELNKNEPMSNKQLKLTAVLEHFKLCRDGGGNSVDTDDSEKRNLSNFETGKESVSAVDDVFQIDIIPGVEKDIINIDPLLPMKLRTEVETVINDNYMGQTTDVIKPLDYCAKIHLKHDTPIFCKPRRLSYFERLEIRKIVNELLTDGIIRPSNSPYASAIVPVRKKDGGLRKCVDYRPLNKITIRDNYPTTLMEDCIAHLGGKRYFTVIDLKSGYHHVRMHPDSIKYTSFVTPDGQYEYVYLPFGLCNAPAEFQRFIRLILGKLIEDGLIVVYMDDILIATADFETHMNTLGTVLKTIRQYGLRIQLKKCRFAYEELEYLGYLANESGITLSNVHLKDVENFPEPKNRKEMERCHGLFSYFRRFVRDFSRIARPMTQLLKKDVVYEFTEDCRAAFTTLKQKLMESPILAIYNPHNETELHCDASACGFGAVLMQKQPDGKFHPVAYYSKTASPPESRLHSYELETLAIVYALRRFHTYLQGLPFKIVTDCNSLALTLQNRTNSAKIARWALLLENYNYTIVHRAGTSMGHVDALSRMNMVAYVNEDDLDFHLQLAQSRDPIIMDLRNKLEETDDRDFELIDGVVYHKSPMGHLQLYVPSEMINNVIRLMHEKVGHLAVSKCCSQIKKHYWFPYVTSRVKNFIANCVKCIYYSASPHSNAINLHPIPKKPIPFDTIHVDHLGPLPSVGSTKKHLLVVTDAFTKFVRLYPATATNTREVTVALADFFRHFSRPRRCISDRGTCFTSNDFTSFMEQNNIQHIKVASNTPRANGQVERVNRVLGPMLGKLTEPLNHANWTTKLPEVEYALNNSIHSSTGFAPSVLLFGIEQRGKIIDELTEYLDEKLETEPSDMTQLRKKAYENLCKAQEINLEQFGRCHKPAPQFEEGNFVVIKNVDTSVGHNKKLIPKFRGPYVIHKKLPNDRYVIRDIDGVRITQMPYDGILDAAKLKLWVDPLFDNPPAVSDATLIGLEIEPVTDET